MAVRRVWGVSLRDESAHQGSFPDRISSFLYGKNASPGAFSADVPPATEPRPVAPARNETACPCEEAVLCLSGCLAVGFSVAGLTL